MVQGSGKDGESTRGEGGEEEEIDDDDDENGNVNVDFFALLSVGLFHCKPKAVLARIESGPTTPLSLMSRSSAFTSNGEAGVDDESDAGVDESEVFSESQEDKRDMSRFLVASVADG